MTRLLRGAIVGLGSSTPEKVLTNFDLEKMIDTSDEWIIKRTGIRERRVTSDGESSATLAITASKRALADAGMDAKELDLIICATISP
ncbi:MAG: 3-oxoacyl-ACP synthase, partial [Planctomycetes bacterium]|nr:3-oxoacyl-ACP synthase [Planctomycetota bacterium]